ncbi:hypothetical protein ACJX0J_042393, partial [Zea mays]
RPLRRSAATAVRADSSSSAPLLETPRLSMGFLCRLVRTSSTLAASMDLLASGTTIPASTNKLGFTPEFLGHVKLVTSFASLLGVGLYNYFLKEVPLRKIFLVLLVTGLNRKFGISDEWFSIGDSLIITILGQ